MNVKKCHYVEYTSPRRTLQASGILLNTQIDIFDGLASLLGLNNGSMYGTQGRKYITDKIWKNRLHHWKSPQGLYQRTQR